MGTPPIGWPMAGLGIGVAIALWRASRVPSPTIWATSIILFADWLLAFFMHGHSSRLKAHAFLYADLLPFAILSIIAVISYRRAIWLTLVAASIFIQLIAHVVYMGIDDHSFRDFYIAFLNLLFVAQIVFVVIDAERFSINAQNQRSPTLKKVRRQSTMFPSHLVTAMVQVKRSASKTWLELKGLRYGQSS